MKSELKRFEGHPFTPGIDPGLKQWLDMRRAVREAQLNGKNFESVVHDLSNTRRKDWIINLHDKIQDDSDEDEDMSPTDVLLPYHQLESYVKSNSVPKEVLLRKIIDTKSLKYLTKAILLGVSVNARFPSNGKTLLHAACNAGDAKMVWFLLEAGASVNVKDERKITPLIEAMQPISPFHSKEIAISLLEHGAKPDLVDYNGRSALHHAVIIQSLDYMQLLMTAEIDIMIADKYGKMAFDYAQQDSFKDLFEKYCYQFCPPKMFVKFRARLIARQFAADLTEAVVTKCDTCKRTLGDCAALKKKDLRYWIFTHGRLKTELGYLKRKW